MCLFLMSLKSHFGLGSEDTGLRSKLDFELKDNLYTVVLNNNVKIIIEY